MKKRRLAHSNAPNDQSRLEEYLQINSDQEKGVVFDVGTRAIRVLCGPKHVTDSNWGKSVFFNDGTLAQLGSAVSHSKQLDIRSPAVQRIVDFILSSKIIIE